MKKKNSFVEIYSILGLIFLIVLLGLFAIHSFKSLLIAFGESDWIFFSLVVILFLIVFP